MKSNSREDLMALCDSVEDEGTFITFLNALASDFAASQAREAKEPSGLYQAAAIGWENQTIDDFFEAASAWARDHSEEVQNPWKRAARIIMAGKIYE